MGRLKATIQPSFRENGLLAADTLVMIQAVLSQSNFFYLQPKFEYTDAHDVSCDVVLIQPIGDLKTIDIKSDNHKLWSIFHIDKILVWNDLLDRYHQFTGMDENHLEMFL